MGYFSKRKFLFTVAFFLIFGNVYAQYTEDPLEQVTDTSFGYRSKELSHSMDSQNCGKGCGAILSHNSQFIMNPALAMTQKQFTMSMVYNYLDSFSFSVSDSKTSVVAGGIIYNRNSGLNQIKTNLSFPFYKFIFGGINVNDYIGRFVPAQKKNINSHSFDLGISAMITKFLYVGFAATDVWTFYGKAIPRKINWQFELNFNDMFFVNNGWQYHLEPDLEKFPDKRSDLKNFDFYTGFEFRISWFRAGIGLNNVSFNKDFTWESTMKTMSLAFYKPSGGGLYGNFMYNKEYMTFSINVVWEPPVQQ